MTDEQKVLLDAVEAAVAALKLALEAVPAV